MSCTFTMLMDNSIRIQSLTTYANNIGQMVNKHRVLSAATSDVLLGNVVEE